MRQLFYFLTLLTFTPVVIAQQAPTKKPIRLESKILDIIDGNFIDKNVIGFMYNVRIEVKKITHNKNTKQAKAFKTKQDIALFLKEIENILNELIRLSEVSKRRSLTKAELLRQKQLKEQFSIEELARAEQEIVTNEYTDLRPQLAACLEKAKIFFTFIISQFIEYAHGAKEQIMILIKESCKKRQRMHSLLMRWGAAKEGEEQIQFKEDVTNFKVFEEFCKDLTNFLEDLILSCPKALKAFNQWVIEQRQRK